MERCSGIENSEKRFYNLNENFYFKSSVYFLGTKTWRDFLGVFITENVSAESLTRFVNC